MAANVSPRPDAARVRALSTSAASDRTQSDIAGNDRKPSPASAPVSAISALAREQGVDGETPLLRIEPARAAPERRTYGSVLPWLLGMIIAVVAVVERLRSSYFI